MYCKDWQTIKKVGNFPYYIASIERQATSPAFNGKKRLLSNLFYYSKQKETKMSKINELVFSDKVSTTSGIDLSNFPKLDDALFSTIPIIAQNPKGSKADWQGLKKRLAVDSIISLNDFRKGLRDNAECEINLVEWNKAKKNAKIDVPNASFILNQSVNWLTIPNNPDVKIGVLKGEKFGTIYVVNTKIAKRMLDDAKGSKIQK